MKKIVSIVLTIVMVVSMFTTISAATVDSLTAHVPNPMALELGMEVLARKSGTGNAYANTLALVEAALANGIGVDYQATLDMSLVRALFDRDLIKSILDDGTAQAEFDAGKVTTEVTVTITYPAKAKFVSSDLTAQSVGRLDAGDIFSEKSRSVAGNTLTIVYQNKENLTVGELTENRDTYLKDIAFYLENELSYNTEDDYHTVTVSMNGSTTLDFSSKTQVVTYSGSSSHIVSANKYHLLKVIPAVPATCTTPGTKESVMCETHKSGLCDECGRHNGYNCGARGIVKPVIEPKIPHQTVLFGMVPATCRSTGIKEHYICLLCKDDFADAGAAQHLTQEEIIIPEGSHTMVVDSNAKEATCTESGLTEGTHCDVCGYIGDRAVIAAKGHTPQIIPAVAAKCTTPGSTAGEKCSECGRILKATQPIAATGHSFGEWVVVTPAGATKEGLKKRTCACGEEETLSIPNEKHTCVMNDAAAVVIKAATCTEEGTLQNYCACGLPIGEPVAISAIGHNATKIDGIEATCTDKGMITHWACANCMGLFRDAECTKKIQSAEIPVDVYNHIDDVTNQSSLRKIPAVAATCTQDGLTEGEKCIKCNIVTIPQKLVRKTHMFETVSAKDATCTEKGIIAHKHCVVCSKDYSLDETQEFTKEEYELPALGHIFGDIEYANEEDRPTEQLEGNGIRRCTRGCGYSNPIRVAKLEHTHVEECEEIEQPATCTANGKKRIVYTCCGAVKEDNIIIYASHKEKYIAAIAPTCYSEGTKAHWYCTVCEKSFEDEACTKETSPDKLKVHKLEHKFTKLNETEKEIVNQCEYCQEIVRIDKENKSDKANVKSHGGIKCESDKAKKVDKSNITITVDSNINLIDRELSGKLEEEISKNEKACEEKVVLDIFIEKVTTYTDATKPDGQQVVDVDKEIISETDDLVAIEIIVPENMRTMMDFMVHRLHKDGNADTIDEITTSKNAFGEYIEIAADKSKVTLHARRFSEYALVGYAEKVNTELNGSSSSNGGGTNITIKFNGNGGSVIDKMTGKPGEKVKLPIPEREGYTFVGWYTDVALTQPFDPDSPITGSLTLYAKWVEGSGGACDGTEKMNCFCLGFVDLDPNSWYHYGVDYVLNHGLMRGTEETTFEPDSSLTRAMLVTVLWRAEGEIEAANKCKFTDVESGSYYEEAVAWAEECGIVTGYDDKAFGPHDNILREQIAAIMYRYSKFKGYDVSAAENSNILSYTDVAEISEYAIPAMSYVVGSGLMNGKSATTLNPQDETTRAEIAVILYRFFQSHK